MTVLQFAAMKIIVCIVTMLLLNVASAGQDAVQTTFHVTSVRSEDAKDWCEAGKCTAKTITVEGYSAAKGEGNSSVEYVLTCTEVIASEPTPHYSVVCTHLHAHNDYPAKVYASAIYFGEPETTKPDLTYAAYEIVSEKETTKRK
jgi:hypothetical protein